MFVFNVFTIYTSKLPNKSMYKVKHFFIISSSNAFYHTLVYDLTAPCATKGIFVSFTSSLELYLEFYGLMLMR